MRRLSFRYEPGFTLIELLCAMSLAGCLLLACGAMMRMGCDSQQAVTRDASVGREARRIFEQMRLDLMAADQRLWHSGSGGMGDPVGWTFLQSAHRQDPAAAVGDLCAVRYELVDLGAGEGDGSVVRGLKRTVADSAAVQQALEMNGDLLPDDAKIRGEALAEGVLHYEVWPLLRDGPEHWCPWHSELAALPDALEVRLRLAGPALQQRLHSSEDWDRAARWPQRLAQGDFRDYQTIIPLGRDDR